MEVAVNEKEILVALLNELPLRFEKRMVTLEALGIDLKLFRLSYIKSRIFQEE